MRRFVLILGLLAALPAAAGAHAIDHRVLRAESVAVEITYPDRSPFSFEEFEVTGPGDSAPFLVGRTDRLGRVVFAPDRPGSWTVKVWSADGHGLTTEIQVDADGILVNEDPAPSGRLFRTLIGVALILVLAVALFLFGRRKE